MMIDSSNIFKVGKIKASSDIPVDLRANTRTQNVDVGQITRIKEMFSKVQLSVSSYDTAWLAMIPSRESANQPCFPGSLAWILENQNSDGSWGLHPSNPLLVKDSLTSTMASVLALHKWNTGELTSHKGLDFIVSNISAATDENQFSPVGFNIIFPGMIESAIEQGLSLGLKSDPTNLLLCNRHSQIKSLKGRESNLAYVAEGLGKWNDWKETMKYQRSNGSLFNSPSTTAAALMHLSDEKCFNYLHLLLQKYENAVPTVYPLDIYSRLSLIDDLERFGVGRYFRNEIEHTLLDTYKCWMQGDEEIFLDTKCFALTFRLLRANGYEVSSDALAEFQHAYGSLRAEILDTESVLELYKASLYSIYQNEPILDNINCWTSKYLKQELLSGTIQQRLSKDVDFSLTYAHANLERIESRRSIENHNVDGIILRKAAYRCLNVDNDILLGFARHDFNMCQEIHREELEFLKRWVADCGIYNFKFVRKIIENCYFTIASLLPNPEFSDARILWAKNTILITVVDDLCDGGGSLAEAQNLYDLTERWDEHSAMGYYSEQVRIIFSAIYETTKELAAKASILQGRNVKSEFIKIWLELMWSMVREAKWAADKTIPSVDDYMWSGYFSIGMGPTLLIAHYFLGVDLSSEVVATEEYKKLHKHTGIIGRLLNDITTFRRESEVGNLNCVGLLVRQGNGEVTEEMAKGELRKLVESNRRELLRMVLQKKVSVVPQSCKDLLWKTSQISHLLYMDTDGFSSSSHLLSYVNAVIHQSITIP